MASVTKPKVTEAVQDAIGSGLAPRGIGAERCAKLLNALIAFGPAAWKKAYKVDVVASAAAIKPSQGSVASVHYYALWLYGAEGLPARCRYSMTTEEALTRRAFNKAIVDAIDGELDQEFAHAWLTYVVPWVCGRLPSYGLFKIIVDLPGADALLPFTGEHPYWEWSFELIEAELRAGHDAVRFKSYKYNALNLLGLLAGPDSAERTAVVKFVTAMVRLPGFVTSSWFPLVW